MNYHYKERNIINEMLRQGRKNFANMSTEFNLKQQNAADLRQSDFKKKYDAGLKKRRQKIALDTNLKLRANKGLNGLEKAGNALLDALGIQYETQAVICGNIVDVLISEKRLIIQWDGDYWHGYKTNGMVLKRNRALADKEQDECMRQEGYTVIRFWEHDVHKRKDAVSEKIESVTSTLSSPSI